VAQFFQEIYITMGVKTDGLLWEKPGGVGGLGNVEKAL